MEGHEQDNEKPKMIQILPWCPPDAAAFINIPAPPPLTAPPKPTHLMKFMITGSSKCGKTSIVRRYLRHDFHQNDNDDTPQATTSGVDYYKTDLTLQTSYGVACVRLQLLDSPLEEDACWRSYVDAIIFVADALDLSSSNESGNIIDKWENDINIVKLRFISQVPVILFLNKIDLWSQIDVDFIPLSQKIERKFVGYRNLINTWYGTSAKTGEQIDDAIHDLVRFVLDHREEITLR